MKKVQQNNGDARSNESGLLPATLIDAARAEAKRARELMATDGEQAAAALNVLDDLLRSVESKLSNIAGLAGGAEKQLGPAALAFAHVDHIAVSALLGGDVSEERAEFSLSIGEVMSHLRGITSALGDIANVEDAS